MHRLVCTFVVRKTLQDSFLTSRPILCFLTIKKFSTHRRVAEIQIFEKTYLIVIKDELGLKFKMNDSTLFLIGSYAQKLVASY